MAVSGLSANPRNHSSPSHSTLFETASQEFRNLLNQTIVAGANNVLFVSGTTGGEASFSGNINFAAAGAIPEPATWAMMLFGFGAVGYSMRRRKVEYRGLQAA